MGVAPDVVTVNVFAAPTRKVVDDVEVIEGAVSAEAIPGMATKARARMTGTRHRRPW
jgi:hypothetical protein